MASFSIDDVRTTMTNDVTNLLSQVEESGRALLAASVLSGDGREPPLFQTVSDNGHAIYGTAALVGADALATTAKALEDFAERGREELMRALEHAARARKYAELLVDGAGEMSVILDLELSHQADDAQWVGLAWRERAREQLTAMENLLTAVRRNGSAAPPANGSISVSEAPKRNGSIAPAAIPGRDAPVVEVANAAPEFSFSDDDDDVSATDPPPDSNVVALELRSIFEQEARELVVALRGHLEAVAADHDNAHAAKHIERLYHTLKGAAATVGLVDVSARAASLQQRAEHVVDGTTKMNPEVFERLVADTNDLLAIAGMNPIQIAAHAADLHASARASADAEARALFSREAHRIHAEASRLLDLVATAGDVDDAESTRVLADLFHRLAGSALVVSEDAIADEARKGEMACQSPLRGVTAEPARCLAAVAALLGPASDVVEMPSAVAEARDAFYAEAAQIIREATRAIASLGGHEGDEARAALAVAFHRLKGSALVVQENELARVAEELEQVCVAHDTPLEARIDALRRGVREIEQTVGHKRTESVAPRTELERHGVDVVQDAELWQAFTQECGEVLENLERELLLLEESAEPRESLKTILRHVHTLKGVVNTMGLTPTGALLHRVEDFVEQLAELPVLPSMRQVASLLLSVQTDVRRNLKQADKGFVETSMPKLQARIAAVLAQGSPDLHRARPIRRNGDSVSSRASHGSRTSGTGGQWRDGDIGERRYIRVSTERLDTLMNLAGELVVSRSRLMSRVQSLRTIQQEMGRGNRRMTETVEHFRQDYEFGRIDGPRGPGKAVPIAVAPPADAAPTATPWGSFTELELDRYEDVNILARSLAEITSDFNEVSSEIERGLVSFTDDADIFGRIVSGIQAEVTRARMVPLELLFTRLRLPIRDAAVRGEKEVKVVTVGEDVSLDKTIADALFEPMIHLVRNAVAHGVELGRSRVAAGKPEGGTITLSARQESGQIVLEVSDDGAGLDLERLRERGAQMGLVAPTTPLTDPAVKDLVFAPGLSTHRSVGDVAGRGVGCDVVRRAIERLNGSIRVDTRAGQGTTFVITLPLTLAITRALLVRQGKRAFAVPLYFAERIVDVHDSEIVESAGRRRIKVDDAFVPVKRLATVLRDPETPDDLGPVLVLRVGEQRVALQVDAVIGQEEIVVKSLGSMLTGHPLFAGITIRGTGDLVLIIDVPSVVADEKTAVAAFAKKGSPPPRPTDEVVGEARPAPDALREVSVSEEASAGSDEGAAPEVDARPRVLRALFVDDSLSVRKVAELTLAAMGIDVTLAVDGVDALERLRERSFDIVFTDLEMPRMHGYELIRELRFLPAYAELPIVVVTSRSGQKHQDQARSLGATDYMTKPFSAQTLEVAIKKWVRSR